MDFKNLLRTARRRWTAITAMLLLGLLVAAVVSWLTPKQYESTAKIFVSADTQAIAEAFYASAYVQGRVQSYADLADHRVLMTRVIDELGLEMSPQQLSGMVSAEVAPETLILSFSAAAEDPETAQAIAQAGGVLFVEYVEELETPRGESDPQVKAEITDPPIVSSDPVQPRLTLNLAAGGLIGLVLGIGLAATREVLDTTVKQAEDAEAIAGAPVMASVGADRRAAREPLLTDIHGFSPRSEAFRLLRTNLQYLDLDQQPTSLVITSAVAGEGKTHTATNLAVALAQTGQRVLVVDGDLRRPRVAETLGLDHSVGLTTVLVGRTSLAESIQVHQPSGVHCLGSGPTPPNPTEVLQTQATRDLLTGLRETYDAIIIDAPPLLPVADASILGTAADGVIIVTRHGRTHRDELGAAVQRLEQVGARLYGVVVNLVPKRAAGGYHYYYYAYEQSGGLSAGLPGGLSAGLPGVRRKVAGRRQGGRRESGRRETGRRATRRGENGNRGAAPAADVPDDDAALRTG